MVEKKMKSFPNRFSRNERFPLKRGRFVSLVTILCDYGFYWQKKRVNLHSSKEVDES